MPEAEFHLHNEAGIRFPPLRPAFTDGDLFFGRFRALISRASGTSEIGEGGTGRIHFVRDELMDREVAIKIPLDSILRDPAARHGVIEETRQAMELTHPNIVRIHDFHEAERQWGISMQFVRGKNLDEWRYADNGGNGHRPTIRPYAVESIRDWIAQLCDALRYAHEDARMVHRDIKPKNLMLERRDGVEKLLITDFGITQRLREHNLQLSRDQSRAGENKGNMGTLPYMPWEQIAGSQPSLLDDVYAVGATIYDLITGRPPFYEGGFEQIKIQIKETVPPRMEQRLSDFGIPYSPIPEEWEQVVAACLAKRPEDRPQSMREMAAALGFQSGSVTHLEALVQSQETRIHELEDRIESLAAGGQSDPRTQQQQAELNSELAAARNEALDFRSKNDEAEQRLAALAAKLESTQRELASAGISDDERFEQIKKDSSQRIAELEAAAAAARSEGRKLSEAELEDARGKISRLEISIQSAADQARQESAGRIRELEADLKTIKQQTGEESAKASESLRRKADALAEKLGLLEAEREKAVANVRDEAEKRLTVQAQELHSARQAIDKSAAEREALDRQLATEKDRQAASIRPALIVMLAALALGLGGGFVTAKVRSGTAVNAEWVSSNFPESAGGEDSIATAPVSWGQFKAYAASIAADPADLLVETVRAEAGGWNDMDPVKGVNWLVAQQFCNWLTGVAVKGPREQYTLPSLMDLDKKSLMADTWEWTSDWQEPSGTEFIGFLVKNGKDPVPYPPVAAKSNFTFRVKLALVPK
jgi:serine/threonine protein kinase